MSHNLFYVVPEDPKPGAKTKRTAIHMGEYATKEDGLTAWDQNSAKFPLSWQPVLLPSDETLAERLFREERVQTIIPAFAAQLKEQFPKLPLAFQSLSSEQAALFQPTDAGMQVWLDHYGAQWGNTRAPEPEAGLGEAAASNVRVLEVVQHSRELTQLPAPAYRGHC